MTHPACNPHLAPSDYFLFRSMAYLLCSWHFSNQEKEEDSVKEFFTSKDEYLFQREMKKLAERWFHTMQQGGLWLVAFMVTWSIKQINKILQNFWLNLEYMTELFTIKKEKWSYLQVGCKPYRQMSPTCSENSWLLMGYILETKSTLAHYDKP